MARIDWLSYVNFYRRSAKLPPVTENSVWSEGNKKHAQYMLLNNYVGHTEDPSKPGYTPQGLAAAQSSNLTSYYGFNSQSNLELINLTIDQWMTAPFHAVGVLDPQLTQVGYGSVIAPSPNYPQYQQIYAGLDVIRGLNYSITPIYPIFWPANGMTVPIDSYESEYPDPLTSSPGYTSPAGLPIILQLGPGNITPKVTASSFKRGNTNLEHFTFDETSYTNPDSTAQNLGRNVLNSRDAIVMIPKEPLTPGDYTASITSNGQTYTWSFTVSTGFAKTDPDMNNDGKSDILLSNTSQGWNTVWLMDGTNYSGFANLPTSAGWKLVGTPDLNQDGKADILLTQPSTGWNSAWIMDGTNYVTGVGLASASGWQAVGVGDFNNDTKPDILLNNPTTGWNTIWLMDETNYKGYANLPSAPGWKTAGVGDFNRDGYTDILLTNPTTGANTAWLMNATSYGGYAGLPIASGWQAMGTADFNGDGMADIILNNLNSRWNTVWLMNGTNYTGFANLPTAPAGWQIAGMA